MSKIPRASLCITILRDEDYRLLMSSKGGAEAFGVFVSLLLAGRERLQEGKVKHPSETDSLIFDNSTTHVLSIAGVSSAQFRRALVIVERVAEQTNGKPWMYIDESDHLVIRSFFKFNTSDGWGGPRPGSGRPLKENQDDSSWNQLDSSPSPSPSPVPVCVLGGGENPTMRPPETIPHGSKVRGPGRDSDEADELGEWAKGLGVDQRHESFAYWAVNACDYAPAAWMRAILQNKVAGRSGLNRASVAVLAKVLQDCLNAGECSLLESRPIAGSVTAARQAQAAKPTPEQTAALVAQLPEM